MNKKSLKEKGITLIALVITIIVLVILAGVSISFVFGKDGIIQKASRAKEIYETQALEEKLKMAKLAVQAANGGKLPADKYLKYLEEQGIIIPDSIVEDEDGNVSVETTDGYVITVTKDENGNMNDTIVEGKGDDLPTRIMELQLETSEDCSQIIAMISVLRSEKSTFTYYYKDGDISSENPYIEVPDAVNTDKKSCTITGLEKGLIYTVKVEGKDKESNEIVTSKEKTIQTGKVQEAEGRINIGNENWNNRKASVEVTKKEGVPKNIQMQYQTFKAGVEIDLQESNWQIITDGGRIENLDLDEVVYVRLWNGNEGGEPKIYTVFDTNPPKISFINGTPTVTTNTITVEISAEDKEAGMPENPVYTYSIGTTKGGNNVATATTTETKHEFSNLGQDSDYYVTVEVKDIAQANGILQSNAIHTKPVPNSITFDYSNKSQWTNQSVVVTINNNAGKEYKVEYTTGDPNSNTGWKEGTSVTMANNGNIYARLKDNKNQHGAYVKGSVTKIDKDKPTITNVTVTPLTTSSLRVAITANDGSGSGIASYTYNVGGKTGTSSTATFDVTGLATNDYTIKVTAIDKMNNTSNESSKGGRTKKYTWTTSNIAYETRYKYNTQNVNQTLTYSETNGTDVADLHDSFTFNDTNGLFYASGTRYSPWWFVDSNSITSSSGIVYVRIKGSSPSWDATNTLYCLDRFVSGVSNTGYVTYTFRVSKIYQSYSYQNPIRGTDTGTVMSNVSTTYPKSGAQSGVWYTYIGET